MVCLIKKYKNRRLYDTSSSQYVTIEQLQNYVLEGKEFRVEDSESGKDLTNEVLLQILVEAQSAKGQFLSTEMLRQLILFANHPMQKSVQQTLEGMFLSLSNAMENNPIVQNYQKATQQWQEHTQEMLKKWQNMFKS